jgi:hypothetical protein
MLSRQLAAYKRFQHIAAKATPARLSELDVGELDSSSRRSLPPILQSGQVASPMVFGYFRPIVLLPADIRRWTTAEERTAILRHELTHVVRRDHAVQCLEFILSVVFFFHPWIRVARRECAREREFACDAEVLRLGSDRQAYAEGILKVAERSIRRGQAIASVSFSSRQDLGRRIDALFWSDRASEGRSLACASSFPAIAAVLITFMLAEPSTAWKNNPTPPDSHRAAGPLDIRGHVAHGASSNSGERVRPGTDGDARIHIPIQRPTPDARRPIQPPPAEDPERPMQLLAPADVGQPMRLLGDPSGHPMHLLDKPMTREDGR